MPRTFTPDDLYAIAQVTDPRISPDGTRIAYVRTVIDRDTYEYQTTIWIVPTEGGESRQFTAGPKDSAPRWSPDGSQIAFLRVPAGTGKPKSLDARDHGDGKPQLYLIAADGGEARRLTHLREGAGPAEWSPDGTTLLFSAETGAPADAEAEDAAVEGKNVPRVRNVEQLFYRFDGHGYIYEHRAHLFTLAVGEGSSPPSPLSLRGEGEPEASVGTHGVRPAEPRQITEGDWNDAAPAWSPDGKQIAFTSDRSDERWRFPASQVWVMDVEDGVGASGGRPEPRRLTSEALGTASPAWSPDGQRIAFLAAPRRGETGHTDLYVVDAAGPTDSERLLTGDFTPVCSDRCIDDQRAAHDLGHLVWAPDGSAIYFLGSLRGETQVYAARPGDGDLLPYSVTQGTHHVYGFSLDRDGRTLALAISDPLTPGDIYVQPVPPNGPAAEDVTPRQLTDVNGALLAEVALASPEEFSFTGADGWELQGWVMRPADAVGARPASSPLPAILQIHGGPAYMYGYSFFFEFQVLAAQGYAVVYSNPRGSTGYGRVFCHAVTHDWGGKDCEDILAGLDAAIARGGIDGSRLGVAGGSYGGYMTNWIVGHSDRFKAAVTMRCVSNFATMFGMSDIGYALSLDEIGGAPWDDLDTLMRHSPITYVGNVTTPLLILHSDQDLRCPLGEAQQMYAALTYRGQPTKLVVFEGQSHDLSRNGHPRSRVRRLREIGDWLARYNPAEEG